MESMPGGDEEPKTVPYSHNEGRIAAIRSLVSGAFQDATSYYEIGSALFSAGASTTTPETQAEIREVASIFYYRIHLERGNNAKPGASLEPLNEDNSSRFWPRPIRAADAEVRKLWNALLEESTEPELQGLLSDLLFSVRHPKPHIYARQAVESYVRAANEGQFSGLHRSEMLVRAWTIMRSLNLRDLEASVEQAMTTSVSATLTADVSAPGSCFPLLRCLLEGRMGGKRGSKDVELPPEAVDYLFAALERYKTDYLTLQLADMARGHLKDSTLIDRALRKAAENLLEQAAQEVNGHIKTHRLEQAAKFARRFHLEDIHAECVRMLQAVDPSSFEWITIRAASSLRPSDIESYLRTFDRPELIEALVYFFETPAPSGSREQNEKLARDIIDNSLTSRIMGTATYGAHGLPQKSYNTDDEKLEHQLNTIENIALRTQGIILSAALDRMSDVHTIPETEVLHVWLMEAYGSDPGLCMSLAQSLSLYWQGNYIACAQLAMPRIEAAIRSILLLLNEPIYRVEEEKSPGQFPGLGFMLPQLERYGFDPDWSSFIRALLLTPGRNLRNLGAHGFLQDIDNQTAALIIRALAVVALLAPEETSKKASAAHAAKDPFPARSRTGNGTLFDHLLVKAESCISKILLMRSLRK
ncbi:hypothetical protein ACGF3J_04390 [Streptomyces sp. NPDC048171]|uniref:hypothetical protein n=1 Tax=Streptomyces sp. NPDC048171 TaxID=3365504 RepID=UPI0037238C90